MMANTLSTTNLIDAFVNQTQDEGKMRNKASNEKPSLSFSKNKLIMDGGAVIAVITNNDILISNKLFRANIDNAIKDLIKKADYLGFQVVRVANPDARNDEEHKKNISDIYKKIDELAESSSEQLALLDSVGSYMCLIKNRMLAIT